MASRIAPCPRPVRGFGPAVVALLALAAVPCVPELAVSRAAARALAAPPDATPDAAPDAVYYQGNVITVDDQLPRATAIAVRGERIVAVGSDQQILALAADTTKRVDLRGRTVLPGLIDSHVHATSAAVYEFDHELPPLDSIEDVLNYIAARAAKLEPGTWIRLQQVFITRLKDQRFPTRAELDRVAPRHPVIYRTGPDVALNSLALSLSGIDKDSQIPEGESGKIERDAAGEPTGILRGASNLVKFKSSERSPDFSERAELLRKLLRDYNAVGITSVSDRSASDSAIKLYQHLRERGELSCRVFLYYGVDPNGSPDQLREQIAKAAGHPLHKYNNELWLRGIKVFLDGGMLTGSAYLRKPWGVSKIYSITDPEYRGTLKIAPDRLYQIAKLALSNQLQMTAHAVGDGAVHNLIAAYEAVNRDFPVAPHRPCITHCNFMSLEAIQKMAKLGIVADLQPAWLYLDGATLTRQFGAERLAYFQPYRSLFEHQVIIGGGSDHMQKIGSLRSVNPYNPFLGMWITLTRQPRRTDQVLRQEQRITREQAIRLYTLNNAYLTFEEREKGSLTKGKLADFIVLDRDILTCPIDQVREIQVLQTYVGGKLVADHGG